MPKIYGYMIGVVLLAALGWWLDNNGYERALADQQLAQKEQLEEDAKTITKLRKEKKRVNKIVEGFKADNRDQKQSDCRTAVYTDSDAYRLRKAYYRITGPKAN